MSQLKIDKFGLFLGTIIIVAVLAASVSLYDLYQSTIKLETYMVDHSARRVEIMKEVKINYYKNTIVVRNRTKDGVLVELYIDANVDIRNITNFNALYGEIHSMVITKTYSDLKDIKSRIYVRMKKILNSPDDIKVYFHTKIPEGKDDE